MMSPKCWHLNAIIKKVKSMGGKIKLISETPIDYGEQKILTPTKLYTYESNGKITSRTLIEMEDWEVRSLSAELNYNSINY